MLKLDKKQHIMLAAEKLFTSRRFHEIKLDDVAKLAKVGKGTIYLYFEDKDDLFFQTATSGFEELCQLLQRKVPQQANFRETLIKVCEQIVSFFDQRHQLFRMISDESLRLHFVKGGIRERWMEKRKLLSTAVASIIQRGVEEGKIRKDIEPDVLAVMLLGMLRSRAWDLQDLPEDKRSIAMIIDLFCNGAFNKKPDINCCQIAPVYEGVLRD